MDDRSSQSLDQAMCFHMLQLINGYRATQAIYVGAKLGIAELLDQTPQGADELALATKTHAPSLRRLLLMLASIRIFAEYPAGKFQQTPLSDTRLRTEPRSVR